MSTHPIPECLSEFALDHIGIAVNSLEEGQSFYKALGFDGMGVEEVPTEAVRVGMFQLNNSCKIELLEPMSDESPIAKFLKKNGPGIHHYCLRVMDIEKAMKTAKEAGLRLLNDTPKPGAHGCKVAFVHPKSAGGVLVEMSQPPPELSEV